MKHGIQTDGEMREGQIFGKRTMTYQDGKTQNSTYIENEEVATEDVTGEAGFKAYFMGGKANYVAMGFDPTQV